jgi:two-component system, NarL family, sensor histidine kinase LiaS
MTPRLGRLRWQLTLSYALVALLVTVAWLSSIFLVSVYAFLISPTTHIKLAEAVARETPALSAAMSAATPDVPALVAWVDARKRDDLWQVYVFEPVGMGLYALDPKSNAITFAITDNSGRVLAQSSPNGTVTAGELPPYAQRLAREAVSGTMDTARLSGRDQMTDIYAVAPIFDATKTVKGVLVVMDRDVSRRQSIASVISDSLKGLLSVMALSLPFGIAFGAIAGTIISRPLTRRIDTIGRTALLWSKGSLDARVADARGDEVGQLSQRLDSMASQLDQLMTARQETASLQERNRIARDLHDSTKQQAYAIAGQLAAAQALIANNPQEAAKRLHEAERLNDALRTELSNLILELRPPQLDKLGLAAALSEYARDWSRQTGITIESKITTLLLPRALEQVIYRIVQESLSNVARHSGAKNVALRFNQPEIEDNSGMRVLLTLADDGHGFNTTRVVQGFGLNSMHQRAAAESAKLSVSSSAGNGTRLTLSIRQILNYHDKEN